MGAQLTVPHPASGPDAALTSLLPADAGQFLDGGPAWLGSGQGQLAVTSRGLVACDTNAARMFGVVWKIFEPEHHLRNLATHSEITLILRDHGPVGFRIDRRLAANIEAIAHQLQRLPPDTVVDSVSTGTEPEAALGDEQPTLTGQWRRPRSILQAGPQPIETASKPAPPLQLDAGRAPPTHRRRWWLWAASAAAVVLILAAMVSLPAGPDDPTTDIVALLGDDVSVEDGVDSLSSTTVTTAVPVSQTPDSQTVTTAAIGSAVLTNTTAPTTQATTASSSVSVATTASTVTTVATTQAPTTATPTTSTSDCHPAYSPCLEFLPGDALNCSDLSSSQKPVTVHDPAVDPYGLDGNNDGVGCEAG